MDQVKIGENTLALTRPGNLDEQLAASTGCSSRELAEMLRRAPSAPLVVAALRPFVATADLAKLDGIAGDVFGVATQAVALLAPQPETTNVE